MTQRASILIVEDDPRLCEVLRVVLAPSPYTTRIAATGGAALEAIEHAAPDLVLVDLGLPDLDGVELIARLVARWPALPVLVLTAASTKARIVAAVQAGARGYLFKEDLGRRLVAAIDETLGGGVVLSDGAAHSVLDYVRASAAVTPSPLTARERQVLVVLARGQTYAEIGATLGISEHTVRTHLRTAYDKLGAANKAEAVAIAMREGWLAE